MNRSDYASPSTQRNVFLSSRTLIWITDSELNASNATILTSFKSTPFSLAPFFHLTVHFFFFFVIHLLMLNRVVHVEICVKIVTRSEHRNRNAGRIFIDWCRQCRCVRNLHSYQRWPCNRQHARATLHISFIQFDRTVLNFLLFYTHAHTDTRAPCIWIVSRQQRRPWTWPCNVSFFSAYAIIVCGNPMKNLILRSDWSDCNWRGGQCHMPLSHLLSREWEIMRDNERGTRYYYLTLMHRVTLPNRFILENREKISAIWYRLDWN